MTGLTFSGSVTDNTIVVSVRLDDEWLGGQVYVSLAQWDRLSSLAEDSDFLMVVADATLTELEA